MDLPEMHNNKDKCYIKPNQQSTREVRYQTWLVCQSKAMAGLGDTGPRVLLLQHLFDHDKSHEVSWEVRAGQRLWKGIT